MLVFLWEMRTIKDTSKNIRGKNSCKFVETKKKMTKISFMIYFPSAHSTSGMHWFRFILLLLWIHLYHFNKSLFIVKMPILVHIDNYKFCDFMLVTKNNVNKPKKIPATSILPVTQTQNELTIDDNFIRKKTLTHTNNEQRLM